MFTDLKMHSDFNVCSMGDSDALNSSPIIIGTRLEGILGGAVTAHSKL
jgi:hypothetical protein